MTTPPFKITKLRAFIATDADGVEGVCGMLNPTTLEWLPMICADEARFESMRPIAQQIADARNIPITVSEFSIRTDTGIIKPQK